MLKLGTETGSLTNHMYSAMAGGPKPEVGMGATVLCWSDSHAATIIHVSPSGKTVTVQWDEATRVCADPNKLMSEDQEYTYARNPNGIVDKYRLTKKGTWKGPMGGLLIGQRREYHDYSF